MTTQSLCYAGIGSRETPAAICALMHRIGKELAARGYLLRSGAAVGADSAFEAGAVAAAGRREIYLPERLYNKHPSPYFDVSPAALSLAASVHPAWHRCRDLARRLHGRNCYQVLGRDLGTPVDFVVCWTKDGCVSRETATSSTGGTRTAIVLAVDRGIPVFNLAREYDLARLQHLIRTGVLLPRERQVSLF